MADNEILEAEAISIVDLAPDIESGYKALSNAYANDSWNDPIRAKETIDLYSTQLRQKHRIESPVEGQSFDVTEDGIPAISPIQLNDISVDAVQGETEQDRQFNHIDIWEEENLKFLDETNNPDYVTIRQPLKEQISETARLKRGEITDPNLLQDIGARAIGGIVDPVLSIFGEFDPVFERYRKPENDQSVFYNMVTAGGGQLGASLAIAGGAAAIGAAPLITPLLVAYGAVQGAGAVASTFREVKKETGSTGEALVSSAIQAPIEYAGQRLGAKGLGTAITNQFERGVGKLIQGTIPKRLASQFVTQGTSESISQVGQNVARRVGLDDPRIGIFENVPETFLGGGVVGAGGQAVIEVGGKLAERKTPVIEQQESVEIAAEETGVGETEVPAPIVEESVPVETTKAISPDAPLTPEEILALDDDITPKTPIDEDGDVILPERNSKEPLGILETKVEGDTITTENGEVYINDSRNNLHPVTEGGTRAAHSTTRYVTPEIALKLAALTSVSDPEGNPIIVKTDGDNIIVQSPYLKPDLTLDTSPTGSSYMELATGVEPEIGLHPVQVSTPRVEQSEGIAERISNVHVGQKIINIKSAPVGKSVGAQSILEGNISETLQSVLLDKSIPFDVKEPFLLETDDNVFDVIKRYQPENVKQNLEQARTNIQKEGWQGETARLLSQDAKTLSTQDQVTLYTLYSEVAETIRKMDIADPQYNNMTNLGTSILSHIVDNANSHGTGLRFVQELYGLFPHLAEAKLERDLMKAVGKQFAYSEGITPEAADKQVDEARVATVRIAELEEQTKNNLTPVEEETLSATDSLIQDLTEKETIAIQEEQGKIDTQVKIREKEVVKLEQKKKELTKKIKELQGKISENEKKGELTKANQKTKARFNSTVEKANNKFTEIDTEIVQLKKDIGTLKTRKPKAALTRTEAKSKERLTAVKESLEKKKATIPENVKAEMKKLKEKKVSLGEKISAREKKTKELLDKHFNQEKRDQYRKMLEDRKKLAGTPAEEIILGAIDELETNVKRNVVYDSPSETGFKGKLGKGFKYLGDKYEKIFPGGLLKYFAANVLTGIGTQEVNIIGGGAAFAASAIPTAIAHPRIALKSLIEGLPRAVQEAWLALATGVTPSRLRQGEDYVLTGPPIVRFAGFSFRALYAMDALFGRTAEEFASNLIQYQKASVDDGTVDPITRESLRNSVADVLYDANGKAKEARTEAESLANNLRELGYPVREGHIEAMKFRILEAKRLRSEDVQAEALAYRKRLTLQNEPIGILGTIYKSSNVIFEHKFELPGGKSIQPFLLGKLFMKVAFNITDYGIQGTPVGAVRAYLANTKEVTHLERQAMYSTALMGSAAGALLLSAASAYKDDEDPFFTVYGAMSNYRKGTEKGYSDDRDFAIKIGEKYFSYKDWVGFNVMLALVGGYMDYYRANKKEPGEQALSTAIAYSMAHVIGQQQINKSFGDFFKSLESSPSLLEGVQSWAGQQAPRFVSGFVPFTSLQKDITGIFMSPKDAEGDFGAKILQGTVVAPLLGKKPAINDFAEPVKYDSVDRMRFLGRVLKQRTTDPTWRWLSDSGYYLPRIPNNITIRDSDKTRSFLQEREESLAAIYHQVLTPKERRKYVEAQGKPVKRIVEAYRERYQGQAFNPQIQKAMNKAISNVRTNILTSIFIGERGNLDKLASEIQPSNPIIGAQNIIERLLAP